MGWCGLRPLGAGLLLLGVAGCLEGQCSNNCPSAIEWRALCGRLRCNCDPGAVAPPAVPTADQAAMLRATARQVLASVVQIHTTSLSSPGITQPSGDARKAAADSGGTGVIIGADGLILTNQHVVQDASEATVILSDGSRHRVVSMVSAPQLDLAVLRIERGDLHPVAISGNPAAVNEPVVAVGHRGLDQTCTIREGLVSNPGASLQAQLDPARKRCYGQLIESSATIEPGFSGGPLLDAAARLVGVNVASASPGPEHRPRGYAIPMTPQTQALIISLAKQVRGASSSPVR
jgi:S1-C subfamily serine protease